MSKHYKSLGDVYLAETFAKGMPPLPRQIHERVRISVQTDKGESEDFTVSDSWYNKAIREKLKLGSQNQDTYYDLIHSRCIDAGILPAGHEDINTGEVKVIYDYILSITGANGINAFFEKFVDGGYKIADTFLGEINKNDRFNIFDVLTAFYGIQFVYNKAIFALRPYSTKTRGSSGPGEAFISFFFFSKKPVVGDLSIPTSGGSVYIEIKKQGGRVGKDLNTDGGRNGRAFYPTLKALDLTAFNQAVKKFKLMTVGDVLLGKGAFVGISGVSQYPGQALDKAFLSSDINYFIKNFNMINTLQQYIGVLQIKSYFDKIKEFDSILIFTEAGVTLGIKREFITSTPVLELTSHLNTIGVKLKRKTETGTLFDKDGFMVFI